MQNDPIEQGLEIVGCPQCAAPAEVVDRWSMPSNDGTFEMVKVMCVLRHWFTVPRTQLSRPAAPEPHHQDGTLR